MLEPHDTRVDEIAPSARDAGRKAGTGECRREEKRAPIRRRAMRRRWQFAPHPCNAAVANRRTESDQQVAMRVPRPAALKPSLGPAPPMQLSRQVPQLFLGGRSGD